MGCNFIQGEIQAEKHYTEQSAKETLASITDTIQILETYIIVYFLEA